MFMLMFVVVLIGLLVWCHPPSLCMTLVCASIPLIQPSVTSVNSFPIFFMFQSSFQLLNLLKLIFTILLCISAIFLTCFCSSWQCLAVTENSLHSATHSKMSKFLRESSTWKCSLAYKISTKRFSAVTVLRYSLRIPNFLYQNENSMSIMCKFHIRRGCRSWDIDVLEYQKKS